MLQTKHQGGKWAKLKMQLTFEEIFQRIGSLARGEQPPENGVWSSSSPGFQGSHWTFTLLTIPGKSFSTVWLNMSEMGQKSGLYVWKYSLGWKENKNVN